MPQHPVRVTLRTIDTVSLAFFSDPRRVSDSIRDLCDADFAACHINIGSCGAHATEEVVDRGGTAIPNAVGTHSPAWLWKRAWQHDRQRRGVDQLNGNNPTPTEGDNPTCYSFDLRTALLAMRVPAQVITLLQGTPQRTGQFVLVDASNRVGEADRILDANAGSLRTEYLCVHPA